MAIYSVLAAVGCVLLGGFTLVELARAMIQFRRWQKGRLEPGYTPTANWLSPLRVALGLSAVALGLFDLRGAGIFAVIAGLLASSSVLITRSPALLRLGFVRRLRGLRIMAGIFAFIQGVHYFATRI